MMIKRNPLVLALTLGILSSAQSALAMEAVSVPEPSSALMLLSGIPALAVGARLLRGLKR